MSDRVKGLVVALEHDMREENLEAIRKAISMIKGVVVVTDVLANSDDYINRAQIKFELRSKLIQLLVDE